MHRFQQRCVDQCLQLFGGYGYMQEYPIARAYADARVTTIYGGTTEVMKTIIAKSLGSEPAGDLRVASNLTFASNCAHMHLATLLEMIESGFDERVVLGSDADQPVTGAQLGTLVRSAASLISGKFDAVVYVGENHALLPVSLLAAAWSDVPFVPVNYRLEDHHLNALVDRQPNPLVLTDVTTAPRIVGHSPIVYDEWLGSAARRCPAGRATVRRRPGGDRAVHQRHHVGAEVGTVATPPPDGLPARIGRVRRGRPRRSRTDLSAAVPHRGYGQHAVEPVRRSPHRVPPALRSTPVALADRDSAHQSCDGRTDHVVADRRRRRALRVRRVVIALALVRRSQGVGARVALGAAGFPETGFVNAYGLTETASTIAVLGPDDHRDAISSDDPLVQRRLSSAGRLLPMVEIELRGDDDKPVTDGGPGIIYLRGEQVSGEYATGSVLDANGWFCTRDPARLAGC